MKPVLHSSRSRCGLPGAAGCERGLHRRDRGLPAWARRSAAWVLAALLGASPAAAQFGQNKVQYRHFRWHVLETAHFKIHYYEQERAAALEAARIAERSYEYLSDFYQHQFTDKIPLVLYMSHQDFEQVNFIGGFIGEGTGGVTESLKGRVTLPLTGSYAELNHVLTHELVHAFQFDLQERNVRGLFGIGAMPLWGIEGMAEWVSNGMDPVTATWVTDAVRRDKLPTLEQMSTLQDIRVYRMGQALYEVIAENHGPERIRRMLHRPESTSRVQRDSLFAPVEPPFPTRDGGAAGPDSVMFAPGTASAASLEKLWKAWADSIARTLGKDLVDPDSVAERLTPPGKYGRSFHLAPALSADGTRVLYYSSRGFRNELFLAEQRGDRWVRRGVVSGEETPELETLPLLSASADWSPDGDRIVFVGTEEGKDALRVYDLPRRRIVRTLRTEMLSISNPSWSPDGRWIVFSALDGGQEDLFLVEAATGRLVRLTQDAYSERTPRFAPEGDALVFATDRGPRTDLRALRFGPWNLARMQLRGGGETPAAESTTLLVESDANDFAPVWSPDGSQVAFVSDRDGTYQVYTLDLAAGTIRRRTRFDTGVVGIVPTGPAFSWSASGHMVFSVFRNGGWHLYRTQGFPDDGPGDVLAERLELTRSAPLEIQEDAERDVLEQDRAYRARLTPEDYTIGALYIGNTGAAGSGRILLSDMLGNHYLLLGGYLRSEIEQSEFLLQYANLGHRWQWGVAGYQYRDELGLFTARDSLEFRSLTRLGVAGQIMYPFNRFRRIELGLDLQTVTDEVARYLYETGQALGVDRSRLYYFIPGVALVHDNSAYAGFTPVAGGRWRMTLERAVGDVDYTFGLLDWRRYLNVRTRSAVALRGLAAGSTGKDEAQLRIGGPETFRGADYGEMEGSRATFASAELRFPLLPGVEILRGVVFLDAAAAWRDRVRFAASGGPLGFHLEDLRFAGGVGLRTFIGLPLRFDAALPTDLERRGDWRTSFSIGFDY